MLTYPRLKVVMMMTTIMMMMKITIQTLILFHLIRAKDGRQSVLSLVSYPLTFVPISLLLLLIKTSLQRPREVPLSLTHRPTLSLMITVAHTLEA